MCLALIAIAVHPRYPLVLAANRDEFHARAATPAAWWDEGFLAGRDLEEGGTWLGIDRRGRLAFLTNVREPSRRDLGAPTRGTLVPRILIDDRAPAESLASLMSSGSRYNGFNLLAGDVSTMHWASNRAAFTKRVDSGIHGVSNHFLDTPWPKLVRAKAALARWCSSSDDDADLAPVFALLGDTQRAPDEELPVTGVSLEWERLLSSPFIVSPEYGTRCTTVVTLSHDGEAHFVERSFDPAGNATGEVDYRFPLQS